MNKPLILIALPAMGEEALSENLLALNEQVFKNFEVHLCINEPETYANDGDSRHKEIADINQVCFEKITQDFFKNRLHYPLFVYRRHWQGKILGVGHARKVAMDKACEKSSKDSIIVCMDADTWYSPHYLLNIVESFETEKEAVALSIPFLHSLPKDETELKAILHYEVYMRCYELNRLYYKLPYAFTAVGSSMACRLEAYRKIGGITPFKSGEDFYFLQKLAKTGKILIESKACSRPSPRISDRVFFGTGPAVAKGVKGLWDSYPIFPGNLFSVLSEAYSYPDKIYALKKYPSLFL